MLESYYTVANEHKPKGRKQYTFVTLQFGTLKMLKSACWQSCAPSEGSRTEFESFSSFLKPLALLGSLRLLLPLSRLLV